MEGQRELLRHYLAANQPVVQTGIPGIGKTFGVEDEIVHQRHGYLVTVIGSIREPSDIAGWPYRTPDGVKLDAPYYAKLATQAYESGDYPIVAIHFDELRRVVPATQNAILRVFLERVVGDVQLPAEIRMLASSNSASDGGWPLESALANRLGHIDVQVDHDLFQRGFITNSFRLLAPMEPTYTERLAGERAGIAAFLKHRSDLLLDYPKDDERRDGPWPSPRSWDMAAHVLSTTDPSERNLRLNVIATAVSTPVAVEYLNWQEAQDLPDPAEVLSGKVKDIVDQARPDRTYAIFSAALSLAFTALESKEAGKAQKSWDDGWKLISRVKQSGAADIAGAFVPEFYHRGEGSSHKLRDPDAEISEFADLLERAGGGK